MCSLEKRSDVYILTLTGDGEHRLNPNLIAALRSCRISGQIGNLRRRVSGEGRCAHHHRAGQILLQRLRPSLGLLLLSLLPGYDQAKPNPDVIGTPTAGLRPGLAPGPDDRRRDGARGGGGDDTGAEPRLRRDEERQGVPVHERAGIGDQDPQVVHGGGAEQDSAAGDRRDVLLAAEKVPAGRGREIGVVDEAHDGAAETVAGAMRLAEDAAAAGCGEAYGERRRKLLGEAIEAIGFDETVEGEEEPPLKNPNSTPNRGRGVSRL